MNEESGLNDHGNDGLYGHCVVNMDQLSAISTLAACSDENIIIHVDKRTRASFVIASTTMRRSTNAGLLMLV